METKNTPIDDLRTIRSLMEKSSVFTSLSGTGAIIVGLWAMAGSGLAYYFLQRYAQGACSLRIVIGQMVALAILVFIGALSIYLLFVFRELRRRGAKFWTVSLRKIAFNFAVPATAGAGMVLYLLYSGMFSLIAPTSIIMYGLATFCASHHSSDEFRLMALLEIALGLVALWFPMQGLWFWMCGFGVMHILVGVAFWYNHERKT